MVGASEGKLDGWPGRDGLSDGEVEGAMLGPLDVGPAMGPLFGTFKNQASLTLMQNVIYIL